MPRRRWRKSERLQRTHLRLTAGPWRETAESDGTPEKRFKIRADEIRPLARGRSGCFSTDHIAVEGRRVGYTHRERPDGDWDSGWRFCSALESDDCANDSASVGIYDVNSVANYDPEIIPLLDSPIGSAFARAFGCIAMQRRRDR